MSDFDPFDLVGQQAKAEAKSDRQKLDQTNEDEDWKWLMQSKRGRRIMWRLLKLTHVFASSFTGNSETFFREGERNIGLKLMVPAHAQPDLYAMMYAENKSSD